MGVLVFSMKKKKPLPAHALDNGEGRNVIWVRTKIMYFMLFTTQGAHTMCVCIRLLFYSKCTGRTVCFTYSDISLSMYINQC